MRECWREFLEVSGILLPIVAERVLVEYRQLKIRSMYSCDFVRIDRLCGPILRSGTCSQIRRTHRVSHQRIRIARKLQIHV